MSTIAYHLGRQIRVRLADVTSSPRARYRAYIDGVVLVNSRGFTRTWRTPETAMRAAKLEVEALRTTALPFGR